MVISLTSIKNDEGLLYYNYMCIFFVGGGGGGGTTRHTPVGIPRIMKRYAC